jgi:hypothetical protein
MEKKKEKIICIFYTPPLPLPPTTHFWKPKNIQITSFLNFEFVFLAKLPQFKKMMQVRIEE